MDSMIYQKCVLKVPATGLANRNHDNYSNPSTQVRAHNIDFGVGLQKA